MKIGFCFLMRRCLKNHFVWSKFFSGIKERRYGIYTHSKCPKLADSQPLLKNTHIDRHIPTAWGDVSLVDATLALFEAAVADGCDYIFLVSDTCVPIHSFNYVSFKINCNSKSRINHSTETLLSGVGVNDNPLRCSDYLTSGETERRFAEAPSIKHFVSLDEFIKASQWVGLCRNDAELLLEDKNLVRYFDDVFAADEHYIPTVINKYGNLDDVLRHPVTYTNWSRDDGDWRHPKEYRWIEREDIHEARSCGAFFMRKILFLSNFKSAIRKYGQDTFKLPRGKNYIAYVHIPKNGGCSVKKFFSYDSRFMNFAHCTASEIKAQLGRDLWDETYVFSTVRNPWARVLSAFTFFQAGGLTQFNDHEKAKELGIFPDTYFNKWVQDNEDNFLNPDGPFCGTPGWMHFGRQLNYLNTDVDKVFRLEDLSVDTPKPFASPLPLDNATTHGQPLDIYNAYSKGIVSAAYKEDIKKFGYSFESV